MGLATYQVKSLFLKTKNPPANPRTQIPLNKV